MHSTSAPIRAGAPPLQCSRPFSCPAPAARLAGARAAASPARCAALGDTREAAHDEGARSSAVDRRALLTAAIAAAAALAGPTRPAAAESADADAVPAAAPGTAAPGITTVFVAGATGQTGRRVVQALRAAGLRVRAGVRDLRKAQSLGFALDPAGIELVTADVVKSTPEELAAAVGGAHAVICCTGYTGLLPSGFSQVEGGTLRLIDAAKSAGTSRFVLLSSLLTNAPAVGQGSNPNYSFLNAFGAVLDSKLAAEKHLRASGLDWTVVRPGGLSNDPPEKVGNLIVSGEDTLFGLDSDPGRAISRDLVADVLVAAVQDPAASGKVFEIVSSPAAAQPPKERWFSG